MIKKVMLFSLIIVLIFCGLHFLFHTLFISAGGAFIAAFAFLLYLIRSLTGQSSQKTKAAFLITALLCMIAVGSYFVYSYSNGRWQQEMLLKVGSEIGTGELHVKLNDIALNTIREYYSNSAGSGQSLADAFSKLYPLKNEKPAIIDTISENFPKKIKGYIYLDSISPDKIVVVGQQLIFRGIDENYNNYGGQKGKAQCRITITALGGKYDIQN